VWLEGPVIRKEKVNEKPGRAKWGMERAKALEKGWKPQGAGPV
jgi:hypothetical protein